MIFEFVWETASAEGGCLWTGSCQQHNSEMTFLKRWSETPKREEISKILEKRDRIIVFQIKGRRVGSETTMVPRCSCNIKNHGVRLASHTLNLVWERQVPSFPFRRFPHIVFPKLWFSTCCELMISYICLMTAVSQSLVL